MCQLKGQMWQIFVGSIHNVETRAGEYHRLLKQHEGIESVATKDISLVRYPSAFFFFDLEYQTRMNEDRRLKSVIYIYI